MVVEITAITDWLAMSLALWLAAFLLIRSHRSWTTWRAVIILAALATAFLLAYVGLREASFRLANAWAAALTLAIILFYDLTYHWLSPAQRATWSTARWVLLALGVLKILYLMVWPADAGLSATSGLSAQPWQATWVAQFDGVYLLLVLIASANNLRLADAAEARPHYRLMGASAWLAIGGYVNAMLSTAWPATFPRLVQNLFLIGALAMLGYAVARYQVFVGRRTTLHDFPVSGATVLGLAALYGVIANRYGFTAEQVVLVTALAILTHSVYDLVREVLDRLMHQRETELRRELRGLVQTVDSGTNLAENMEQALVSTAGLLNAASAFVAQRENDHYRVLASFRSLPLNALLPAAEVTSDEAQAAGAALAERINWLAPVHIGLEQVAVVGVGARTGSTAYSAADIDMIDEVADWISRMFEADRLQRENEERRKAIVVPEPTVTLIEQLKTAPDAAFVRLVEDGLRHVADYSSLGDSALAAQAGLPEGTHLERGKILRTRLMEAVEALRPGGVRPGGVLPREWHSYAILYDAYIEDVPNSEIMARLYISEGAFNRLRRKAVQAVARTLWERRGQPAGEAKSASSAQARTSTDASLAVQI
jgi:hypothetical protein